MQILHATLTSKGGAAVATRRISAAQILIGLDSKYLAIQESLTVLPTLLHRLGAKVDYQIQLSAGQQHTGSHFRSLGVDSFTENFVKTRKNKEILNLHWVPGQISRFNLLQENNIPTVITMHDMHTFTGYCHSSLGCSKYKEKCEDCPQLPKRLMKLASTETKQRGQFYQKWSNISFVSPSIWLSKKAEESRVLSGKKIEVIHNPIPVRESESERRSQKRRELKIGDELVIMLLGTNLITKGGENSEIIVKELYKVLPNTKLKFVFIGSAPIAMCGFSWLEIPEESSINEMINFMEVSDLMIYCSPADNLPNLVLEAQSTGLPVISWNIGGIGETFEDGVSGFLTERNLDSVIAKAVEVIANKAILEKMRPAASSFIKKNFDPKSIAEQYKKVYNDIL